MILHSLMSCSFCVCVQRLSCCEIPKLFDTLNLMHFVSILCPVVDTVLISVLFILDYEKGLMLLRRVFEPFQTS